MIARGGLGLWAREIDHEEFERELRIEARGRALARCADDGPPCSHCRGCGGVPEYDPDGRPLTRWEPCDACAGTGVGEEPPRAPIPVCAPITSPSVVTDFGVDDVPF